MSHIICRFIEFDYGIKKRKCHLGWKLDILLVLGCEQGNIKGWYVNVIIILDKITLYYIKPLIKRKILGNSTIAKKYIGKPLCHRWDCIGKPLCVLYILALTAHRDFFSESCSIKPKLDCNYTISIDLAPNGIPLGSKLSGKECLQSNLGLV